MESKKRHFERLVTLKAAAFGSHFVVYEAEMTCHKCFATELITLDHLMAEAEYPTMWLIYFIAVTGRGWIVNDSGSPILAICPKCAKTPELKGEWEKSIPRWFARR